MTKEVLEQLLEKCKQGIKGTRESWEDDAILRLVLLEEIREELEKVLATHP